VQVKRKNN